MTIFPDFSVTGKCSLKFLGFPVSRPGRNPELACRKSSYSEASDSHNLMHRAARHLWETKQKSLFWKEHRKATEPLWQSHVKTILPQFPKTLEGFSQKIKQRDSTNAIRLVNLGDNSWRSIFKGEFHTPQWRSSRPNQAWSDPEPV